MSNYGKSVFYRICDIEFQDIQAFVFDGAISLLKYYEEKYKIKIKNMNQPLLVTESKNRRNQNHIYLIPELMLMAGIPDNFD